MPIQLVLVDDHPIVLHGLRQLFENQADMNVVECCADGDAGLEAVRSRSIDVLLLDLRMPGRTGLDVMRAIAAEQLQCRTILLTAAMSDEAAVEAIRLGARGVIFKESAPEALLDCVRRVHAGEQWID